MKRIFTLFFFFALFSTITFAQEKESPYFSLKSENVNQQLVLESDLPQADLIRYTIFKTGTKSKTDIRLDGSLQMPMGKKAYQIDITQLAQGEYFIEVYKNGEGRLFRKIFTKN